MFYRWAGEVPFTKTTAKGPFVMRWASCAEDGDGADATAPVDDDAAADAAAAARGARSCTDGKLLRILSADRCLCCLKAAIGTLARAVGASSNIGGRKPTALEGWKLPE